MEDNYFLKTRNRIYEYLTKTNSIDKLMRDKVEPYVIIDELPIPIQIGEKVIYVGNLNLKNEDYYFSGWAKILAHMALDNMFIELMSDGSTLFKYLKIRKGLRKDLTKLIYTVLLKQQRWYYPKNGKEYKLNKCSYKYFENHMNKEKLIQMVFMLYLYNYDSSKKSLGLVVNQMAAGPTSATYMYNWLANCPGVNGSFLLSQLPKLSWFQNDSLKSDEEKDHIKENES